MFTNGLCAQYYFILEISFTIIKLFSKIMYFSISGVYIPIKIYKYFLLKIQFNSISKWHFTVIGNFIVNVFYC